MLPNSRFGSAKFELFDNNLCIKFDHPENTLKLFLRITLAIAVRCGFHCASRVFFPQRRLTFACKKL